MLHTGLEESSYSLEVKLKVKLKVMLKVKVKVKDLPVFLEFVPSIPPSYSYS